MTGRQGPRLNRHKSLEKTWRIAFPKGRPTIHHRGDAVSAGYRYFKTPEDVLTRCLNSRQMGIVHVMEVNDAERIYRWREIGPSLTFREWILTNPIEARRDEGYWQRFITQANTREEMWRIRSPRSSRTKHDSHYTIRYFPHPTQLLLAVHRKNLGDGSLVGMFINGSWRELGPVTKFSDWLLTAPPELGKDKEYWKATVNAALIKPRMEERVLRWRLSYRANANMRGHGHVYIHDDAAAIRAFIACKHEEKMLRVQIARPQDRAHGLFYPEKGDCFEWLTTGEDKLGRTPREWRELIEKIKTIMKMPEGSCPFEFNTRPLVYGLPEALLTVTQRSREFEISDELVDVLDHLNRPYVFDKAYPKINRLWPAASNITKRLWPNMNRVSPSTGKPVDVGNFLSPNNIREIVSRTNITLEQFESHLISIRSGGSGRRVVGPYPKRMSTDLARLFGFYYSSGSYLSRERPDKEAGRSYVEENARMLIGEEVLPMFEDTVDALGGDLREKSYERRMESKAVQMNTTRSKRRPSMLISTVMMDALRYFGLQLPDKSEAKGMSAKASSNLFHPEIPPWITENKDYLDAMIEGYINGQHSVAQINYVGFHYGLQIIVTFYGRTEEESDNLAMIFKRRFEELGIHAGKSPFHRNRGHFGYRLSISGHDALMKLADHYEIVKTGLRSRLILKIDESARMNSLLRELSPTETIILGCIYESPKSREDLLKLVTVNPESLRRNLISLGLKGVITQGAGLYRFDAKKFEERKAYSVLKEIKMSNSRVGRYSTRLLNQCQSCGRVYLKPRGTCHCGGAVVPVKRADVIKPIIAKMNNKRRELLKMKLEDVEAKP